MSVFVEGVATGMLVTIALAALAYGLLADMAEHGRHRR